MNRWPSDPIDMIIRTRAYLKTLDDEVALSKLKDKEKEEKEKKEKAATPTWKIWLRLGLLFPVALILFSTLWMSSALLVIKLAKSIN